MVCVLHHVHQSQFNMYFRWPVSYFGRVLEGPVSRRIYGTRPFIAVSPSTRASMRRELAFRGPVHIVPNGMGPQPASCVQRSPSPSIALVTRLAPHKQLDHLVGAVPELLPRWPELRVHIAGTGLASESLISQVRRAGLERTVSLPGRVSEQEKSELLSRAWLTVASSAAEGWGLTVIEANAVGTPAVAYDVPGLRDSVRHGETGWLVRPGQSLAAALNDALTELSDPRRQRLIAERARQWAGSFSWDWSAERLAAVVLTELRHQELGNPDRRRPVDLATVASWPPDSSGELERLLRKALRITDVVRSDEKGVRALLVGCDEVDASRALARVPVAPSTLRLATTSSVLSGVSGQVLS